MGTIEESITKILKLLENPLTKVKAKNLLDNFFVDQHLTRAEIEKIRVQLRESGCLNPLKIEWSNKNDSKEIVSSLKNISSLQLGKVLFLQSYYTHLSALYALGIVTQPPQEFTLTKERNKYGSDSVKLQLTDGIIEEQFSKPPRISNRMATFEKVTYRFSEKEAKESIGVIAIPNRENNYDTVLTTNLARTLLDLIINPEIIGGFPNTVDLCQQALIIDDINIEELTFIYEKLSFQYPYWQRVGLTFDLLELHEHSKKWLNYFGIPKYTFFSERNGKSSKFSYNNKWKIFYTLKESIN